MEDGCVNNNKITEKLDNTATYENWLIIQEYIDRAQQKVEQLEKENKILKDTILKALEFINNHTYKWKDTQFGEMVEVEDFEPGLKPIELINILKNKFENK